MATTDDDASPLQEGCLPEQQAKDCNDNDNSMCDVETVSITPQSTRSGKNSENHRNRNRHHRKSCQECKRQDALYVCPGCSIRTCSLLCCRGHKDRTGCNGKRDRTAFLPVGRMTDGNLRSDYFFLEEVLDQMPKNKKRVRDSSTTTVTTDLSPSFQKQQQQKKTKKPQQQQSEGSTTSNISSMNNSNNKTTTTGGGSRIATANVVCVDPVHYKTTHSNKARKLVQQAQLRGITLKLMPPIMERHKSNNSWYSHPKATITWKLEVILFPNKNSISFTLSEHEENIMKHIMKHCTSSNDIFGDGGQQQHDKEMLTTTSTSTSTTIYHLFLKKIPSSSNKPKYISVDPTSNLKTILAGETIIEYPTIYCVPENQINEFPTGSDLIVELSEEEETKTSMTTTSSSPPKPPGDDDPQQQQESMLCSSPRVVPSDDKDSSSNNNNKVV